MPFEYYDGVAEGARDFGPYDDPVFSDWPADASRRRGHTQQSMPCRWWGIFFSRAIHMNESFVPTTVRLVQAGTNQSFTLHPSTPADWAGQWPTERTVDVLVSEAPGTAMGSLFAYWVGNKTLESPGVLEAIKAHLDDHDVVGIHVIFAFPDDAHSSLKEDLAQLKAAAEHPVSLIMQMFARADAICVDGQTMVREWKLGKWTGDPLNNVIEFNYKVGDIDRYVFLDEESITAGTIVAKWCFCGLDQENTSISIRFFQLAPLTTADINKVPLDPVLHDRVAERRRA